jgi:hypothetical protein
MEPQQVGGQSEASQMVPMHAAIVSLESTIWIQATYYSAQLCQEQRCLIRSSASDDRPANSGDDLVITPGGPRPRHKVHHVRPGEAVRQNENGTYTIVPNDVPASPEPKNKKQNEN